MAFEEARYPSFIVGVIQADFTVRYVTDYKEVWSPPSLYDGFGYLMGYDTAMHPTRAKATRIEFLPVACRLMEYLVCEGYKVFIEPVEPAE